MSHPSPAIGPPPLRQLDAVLFDAGLTLIRPVKTIERIYAGYADTSGIPLEELVPLIRRHFGELFGQARLEMAAGVDGYVASDEADRRMWRRLCYGVAERIPGLTDDPEAWFEALYGHFGRPETWQLFDDVAETLSSLRARGLALGIVSNWDSRLLGILEGHGLTQQLDCVVISAVAGVRKPGPQIFSQALAALDVEPGRALMVGDSVTDDIEGARGAGLLPLLIARGPEPIPPGVPAVTDLRQLLDSA